MKILRSAERSDWNAKHVCEFSQAIRFRHGNWLASIRGGNALMSFTLSPLSGHMISKLMQAFRLVAILD